MGGLGSGNWYRWQGRKSTVEESLTLAIGDFRDRLHPSTAGTFTWTSSTGGKSSVSYSVDAGDPPTITLDYRLGNREDVRIPIQLQATSAHFGGWRLWFTCPLTVNGVVCHRRVGKIYLPPGAKLFGCRHCHRLTYRSCQESHFEERLFEQIQKLQRLTCK